MWAANCGVLQICHLLLDAGAAVDQLDPFYHFTPLILAARHGHTQVNGFNGFIYYIIPLYPAHPRRPARPHPGKWVKWVYILLKIIIMVNMIDSYMVY